FSRAAAARAAWAEVARGPAASLTAGLEPIYSSVQVNDRTFTRLRVRLPGDQAARLCRLAEVSDPWCRSAA
ncbi:MAG: SPOR domain-containing protein, partial [Caulobacter sp.]